MVNCAFLGLGVMGYPMAGHLVRAGHSVNVWNRTSAKSSDWAQEYAGRRFERIEDAVAGCEFIFICVGEDKDVYEVIEPCLKVADKGTIIVDHTTASDNCAKRCYFLASKRGVGFIDAPISGGEAGAVNGALTVMCGGDDQDFEKAKPVIDSYAKAVKLMGGSGAGQLTKMVNQICIAGMVQALSEGVYFAQSVGLDVGEVVQAIGKGAAQSWQMDNRAITMARDEFEFGFAVDWMRKDLKIALETAAEHDCELPVTAIVDQFYAEIQQMGGNRWDTSSLLRRLTRNK